MIKPTVGRILWYRPDGPFGPTQAAIVCGVNSDNNVNLSVFGIYGEGPKQYQGILLSQDEESPPRGAYAQWMPFQVGQAARQEQELTGTHERLGPRAGGPHSTAD